MGGVVALGEQDEGVEDAQLGAPLVEGHAELVVEQPAQGAAAGPDPPPELGQRGVVLGPLAQHPGDGAQPVVGRLRQVQGLFGSLVELVDEDAAQAGAGAIVADAY